MKELALGYMLGQMEKLDKLPTHVREDWLCNEIFIYLFSSTLRRRWEIDSSVKLIRPESDSISWAISSRVLKQHTFLRTVCHSNLPFWISGFLSLRQFCNASVPHEIYFFLLWIWYQYDGSVSWLWAAEESVWDSYFGCYFYSARSAHWLMRFFSFLGLEFTDKFTFKKDKENLRRCFDVCLTASVILSCWFSF